MCHRLNPWASLLCAGILFAISLPRVEVAHAATFAVTTTEDGAHVTPVDATCRSTLPGNPCTLRAAVQAVGYISRAGDLGPHRIELRIGGIYRLTITGAGEDEAATGDLDFLGYGLVTVTNTSHSTVIVDGNGTDRVFDLGGPNFDSPKVTIEGITIQHGVASFAAGGAILVRQEAALTLNNVTLIDNLAEGDGGAISLGSGVPVTLNDVVIQRNSAGNNARFSRGGGIASDGNLTLNRVVLSHNSASSWGCGLFVSGSDGRSTQLTDVLVSSNTSQQEGGGIFSTAPIIIDRTTISNNTAGNINYFPIYAGGGGLNLRGPASLTNVTISGNTMLGERGDGGGIVTGGTTLTNVTISGNTATRNGGGIFSSASALTMRSTILANNQGGGNCNAPMTSAGDNISSDNSCGLHGTGDQSNTDPKLGPLQNNGGFAPTHALLPGSPAIDAVVYNGCPPPSTDERGFVRPAGPRCDSGAFELGALAPTPVPVACQPRPAVLVEVVPAGPGQLRATVSVQTNSNTPTNSLLAVQLTSATDATVTDLNGIPLVVPSTPTIPAGANAYSFLVRSTTGGGAMVQLTVTDACGAWPTFAGGGPSAFGGSNSPALSAPVTATPGRASSTSTVPPPPTSPPTGVPSPKSQVCAPRPAVRVSTAPVGAGRLQVTVAAEIEGVAVGNALGSLRFGAATNATVEAGGQRGPGNFTVTLAPGTQQTQFTLARVTAGQAASVTLTVTDSCGDWPTFVGGGPGTF